MDLLIRLIADGLVVLVFVLGAGTFLLTVKENAYQRYVRAYVAGLTAFLVAKVLSLLYESAERPFIALGVEPKASFLDNPGFPSDHALFVMTITFIIYAATRRSAVGLILLGLSVLVCIGRVIALVHAPIDVIGGVIAAYIGVALWYGWRLQRP
ncbi:hypothetical protein CYG49_01180 [Candidatus Saccharibacteria bacterium]|nr:MAG: hypothetical protein CYG49_01180 [Candidatus Saccharibacteria bacterium]